MPKELADDAIEKTADDTRDLFDVFLKKKQAEREIEFSMGDENITMLFRAIGSNEYDKLIAKHPPTYEQKAAGSNYNADTFGPAILAKVCVDPEFTVKQWTQIWNSPNWNRGEVVQLFFTATELCNRGFDIPFTEND